MKERKRIVHLLIGPLLFGLFTALLPHGVFTTFESRAAIGTIMWMADWWGRPGGLCGNCIPPDSLKCDISDD